jgi:hypothetical protein
MLQLLDESIEKFLRAEVRSLADVDVAFEAPDREWGAGLNKPTVNLFLWDLRRNLDQRDSGMELVGDQDGKRYRRPPLPRVACRYLATVWAPSVDDEHRLLGDLLSALLIAPELPAGHLQGPLADLLPLPSIEVALPDSNQSPDFWSALGGQLKPGLDVVITVTVDATLLAQAGEPTDRHELRLSEIPDPKLPKKEGPEEERIATSRRTRVAGQTTPDAEGTVVRSLRGLTKVDEQGRFLIPADPGDEIVIETDPLQRQRVSLKGRLNFVDRKVRRRQRR